MPALNPAIDIYILLINLLVCLYLNPAMEPAMITPVTNPGWMKPMMPPEEGQRRLEDAAFDLLSRASSLVGQTNPIVTASDAQKGQPFSCPF